MGLPSPDKRVTPSASAKGRACPYCAKWIMPSARVCPHCGRMLVAANTRLSVTRRSVFVGTGRAGDVRRIAQELGRKSMALIECFPDGGAAKKRRVPTCQRGHQLKRSPPLLVPNPSTVAGRCGPKLINLAERPGEQLVTIEILSMTAGNTAHRSPPVVSLVGSYGELHAK
jgi:hypothetical protein